MMLRVSSPLCGSCVEYALDAVFISVEKTPTRQVSRMFDLNENICQDKMQVVQFLQLFSLDL